MGERFIRLTFQLCGAGVVATTALAACGLDRAAMLAAGAVAGLSVAAVLAARGEARGPAGRGEEES